jgi:hypothetical protein
MKKELSIDRIEKSPMVCSEPKTEPKTDPNRICIEDNLERPHFGVKEPHRA